MRAEVGLLVFGVGEVITDEVALRVERIVEGDTRTADGPEVALGLKHLDRAAEMSLQAWFHGCRGRG